MSTPTWVLGTAQCAAAGVSATNRHALRAQAQHAAVCRFDPLGLMDPEGQGGFINQAWLQYSEVIHARWAMLGAAGKLAPCLDRTRLLRPALVCSRRCLRAAAAACAQA